MSKSKVPAPPATPSSWQEVDTALGAMCILESRIDARLAQMNSELAAVRARHEPDLTAWAERFEALKAGVAEFAEAHKAEFTEPRTVERAHGTLSFQRTPPAVAPLSRKWTWKKILEAAERLLPHFIRRPPELDKMMILTSWKDRQVTDEQLAQAGMRISQGDIFKLELKGEARVIPPTASEECAARGASKDATRYGPEGEAWNGPRPTEVHP